MIDTDQVSCQIQQWLDDIVIGLGLCPFAEQPVTENRHRISVLASSSTDSIIELLGLECKNLAMTSSKQLETVLVILPHVLDNFLDFNDFMLSADEFLISNDWSGEFQLAGFHPRYQFYGTEPEATSNLTNRSPYPIIHILREQSVSWAVDSHPDVNAIPKRNMAVIDALSNDQIARLFSYL